MAYNRVKYLRESLDSVLSQNIENYSVILSDNSTNSNPDLSPYREYGNKSRSFDAVIQSASAAISAFFASFHKIEAHPSGLITE